MTFVTTHLPARWIHCAGGRFYPRRRLFQLKQPPHGRVSVVAYLHALCERRGTFITCTVIARAMTKKCTRYQNQSSSGPVLALGRVRETLCICCIIGLYHSTEPETQLECTTARECSSPALCARSGSEAMCGRTSVTVTCRREDGSAVQTPKLSSFLPL